ncbi:hypothetical protein HC891_25940 [Candidatus Gracilibacteria bacterium]|nr:hypothetical protein [Candidatus Gracilibacteria bacterium]
MRTYQLILAAIVAILLSACGQTSGLKSPQSRPLQIDDVGVEIAESYPVQVFAIIKATLPDGCSSKGVITQSREGNTITIAAQMNHSGDDVCTMIVSFVDERIALEGDFPPGEYLLKVNDVETKFTI